MIQSIDDARLEPYRDLKRPGETRWNRPLIAEGHRVVKRALRLNWPVLSLLVSDKRLNQEPAESLIQAARDAQAEILVVQHSIAEQIVGFNFHAGIMAHLQRPRPERLESWVQGSVPGESILAFSRMSDPENVGMAMRNAAAFGVSRLLVGSGSADPLGRRALRLSMGAALKLRLLRTSRFPEALEGLRREGGFQLAAAVCDPAAAKIWELDASKPVVFLLGNESDGLEPEIEQMADVRVTIPLTSGVDSLNVATSAAILLYEHQRSWAQRHAD